MTQPQPKKTLHEALTELMYDSAIYSHPCDYDEGDLSKARGVITIHEIQELLEAHSDEK